MIDQLFSLAGKAAIVTGANRGIGLATTRLLAAAGAAVAIVNRDGESGQALATALNKQGHVARAFSLDVADEAAVRQMVTELAAEWGHIDILVNNAGIIGRNALADTDTSEYDRIMDINLRGAYFLAQAVLPHMQAAGGGRVINIASTHARVGYANRSAYAMSKAAMVQMTRSLAVEWAPYNITCNAVCPHATRTDMIMELERTAPDKYQALIDTVPLKRIAEPADIANAVLYFASPAAAYVTGQALYIDGGWTIAK